MGTPKVSVIMAAYNCAEFIREAIDSILNQSLQDFEIIVVNDCSTDHTADVVSSYSDPRVILINNKENRGAPFSRNQAIKRAQGQYLAIQDADDVSLPGRFELQAKFLDENNDYSVVGSYVYEIDGKSRKLRTVKFPVDDQQLKSSMLFVCSIVHSSAMIRRDFFIRENLFYDETFPSSQDYEMWSRAMLKGKMYTLPVFLAEYRRSANQMSQTKKEVQHSQAVRVYEKILRRIGLTGSPEELEMHLTFCNQITPSSSYHLKEILSWAVTLYLQLQQKPVVSLRSFGDELLLRFVRYSYVNNLGILKSVLGLIYLHVRLRLFRFPYVDLYKRRSVRISS